MKKLLLLLFIVSSAFTNAQEVDFHTVALKYLQSNGTSKQYEGAIDQLFTLLKQQYAEKNVSQATWDELRYSSSEEIDRILNMLVSAYRGNYEKQDLVSMLAFNQTPTGRQLIVDRTALSKEQRQIAADFYNSPTGQKILTSKQQVAHSVSEVSEIWSRDLYRMVEDKLAAKGFTLH